MATIRNAGKTRKNHAKNSQAENLNFESEVEDIQSKPRKSKTKRSRKNDL